MTEMQDYADPVVAAREMYATTKAARIAMLNADLLAGRVIIPRPVVTIGTHFSDCAEALPYSYRALTQHLPGAGRASP
jgi:hypothetical protein